MEAVYVSPKTGKEAGLEGIAILSRTPFLTTGTLDLGGQGRIAQAVSLELSGRRLIFANIHAFWQPGESKARLTQIENLIDWIKAIQGDSWAVICGDFNGTPESKAVQRIRQDYSSAYASVHGSEPSFTCPTPLKRGVISRLRTIRGYIAYLRPLHMNPFWRGTLDYIFTDPRLRVADCQVVLNQPSRSNPSIYPSDHFGLCATLE